MAHEVTNVGTDRHQLSNIAEPARTEMGVETLDAVADRGYYASEEIRACEESRVRRMSPSLASNPHRDIRAELHGRGVIRAVRDHDFPPPQASASIAPFHAGGHFMARL